MSQDAAFRIGIVAEGQMDAEVARELALRVLDAEADWVDAATLCRWHGLDAGSSYVPWKSVMREARRRRIVRHGQFRSSPGVLDQRQARLALRLFMALEPSPDAVVLIRDTDNASGRRESLEQLLVERHGSFALCMGFPHPKLECWILAGFEPADATEVEALQAARQRLGFDPCSGAHRLTAEGSKGKRNAKSVLAGLARDRERQQRCWQRTALQILKERGVSCGLAEYLDAVRSRLWPVVAGEARR